MKQYQAVYTWRPPETGRIQTITKTIEASSLTQARQIAQSKVRRNEHTRLVSVQEMNR